MNMYGHFHIWLFPIHLIKIRIQIKANAKAPEAGGCARGTWVTGDTGNKGDTGGTGTQGDRHSLTPSLLQIKIINLFT